MSAGPRYEVIGLAGLPEIVAGDDLGAQLEVALSAHGPTHDTDIVVVAQKVVSKAEGCLVSLDDITPSPFAATWAGQHGRDPRLIELVLRQSHRIVRMERGILIVETRHGLVCANAGVDTSNVPPGHALTLPEDPDASASRLRESLHAARGAAPGVIVSDTFGRPWREGLVNVAIGVAGVRPLEDYRGSVDAFGRRLDVSVLAVADELASAAELVMGKARQIPAVLVRGLDLAAGAGRARALVRPSELDLFR